MTCLSNLFSIWVWFFCECEKSSFGARTAKLDSLTCVILVIQPFSSHKDVAIEILNLCGCIFISFQNALRFKVLVIPVICSTTTFLSALTCLVCWDFAYKELFNMFECLPDYRGGNPLVTKYEPLCFFWSCSPSARLVQGRQLQR